MLKRNGVSGFLPDIYLYVTCRVILAGSSCCVYGNVMLGSGSMQHNGAVLLFFCFVFLTSQRGTAGVVCLFVD